MVGLGDAELGPDILGLADVEHLLRKDARAAVRDLISSSGAGLTVVRFLLETYYDHQHNRMEAANRRRAALEATAPTALMAWLEARESGTELAIKALLTHYTDEEPTGMGQWARGVIGIGPIISAGLLAYIDMERATNPSKIWRIFGLDPTNVWLGNAKAVAMLAEMWPHARITDEAVAAVALKLGRNPVAFAQQARNKASALTRASLIAAMAKRPWNARAKVLAWKIGDSFCKVHNRPGALYGRLYAERKVLETARNEAGEFAEQARRTLDERKIHDPVTRGFYESGRLPPGRIEQRARRVAVKIFLVHWWQEAWRRKYGTEPPRAYPIAILGHADEIRAAG